MEVSQEEILKECIIAAHDFERAGTYARAKQAIEALLNCMRRCQQLPLPRYILYLLSKEILANLKMAVQVENSQARLANEDNYFEKVLVSCINIQSQYLPKLYCHNTLILTSEQEDLLVEAEYIIKEHNEIKGSYQINKSREHLQQSIADEASQQLSASTTTYVSNLLNLPEELQRQCIVAANNFKNERSYEDAKSEIKNLFNCMTKCELPMYSLYLLSNDILAKLKKSVQTESPETLAGTNDENYIEEVLKKTFTWYSQYLVLLYNPKDQFERYNFSSHNHQLIEVVENLKKSSWVKIDNFVFWTWPGMESSLGELSPNFDSVIKEVQFNISLNESRFITHATSALIFIDILKDMQRSKESFVELRALKASCQYIYPKLVWTGVNLTENEIGKIPTKSRKRFDGEEPNRYGSVVLKFPLHKVLTNNRGLVLGTRYYMYELSKTILVLPKERKLGEPDSNFGYLFDDRGNMDKLKVIQVKNFELGLDFDINGCWTHPEIAFVDNLKIPLEDLTISFSRHECIINRKMKNCKDCTNNSWEKNVTTERIKKVRMHGVCSCSVEDVKEYFKYRLNEQDENFRYFFKTKLSSEMFSQGCFEYLTS